MRKQQCCLVVLLAMHYIVPRIECVKEILVEKKTYRHALHSFLPLRNGQAVFRQEAEVVGEDAENESCDQELQQPHRGGDASRHEREPRHDGGRKNTVVVADCGWWVPRRGRKAKGLAIIRRRIDKKRREAGRKGD